MWIENKKLTAVDTALEKGKADQLDQILAEILTQQESSVTVQTCPQCHKDLVHKSLPYLEIFVNACPNNHGVWMSPEVNKRFQEFLSEQISIANQRRYRLKLLARVLAIVLLLFLAIHVQRFGPQIYQQTVNYISTQYEGRRINAQYWPKYDYTNYYPFPFKDSSIDHIDELSYFREWMKIMEEGGANRLNIHKALSVQRPREEYLEIEKIYAEKQEIFFSQLNTLTPPDRLKSFHETVISAAQDQIVFWDEFVQKKYEKPKLQLGDVLNHPRLQDCNKKLWQSYYIFRDLYPQRDLKTNDAIEQRLCLFDLI